MGHSMTERLTVSCPDCKGEGVLEVVTGRHPTDDSWTGYTETCGLCEGRGGIPEHWARAIRGEET